MAMLSKRAVSEVMKYNGEDAEQKKRRKKRDVNRRAMKTWENRYF